MNAVTSKAPVQPDGVPSLSDEELLRRMYAARVYDVARETALQPAPLLSTRYGRSVALKREDQQPVFSFKLRGAYNKMSRLDPPQRACGVIAASAGNHAQGVALAAAKLGIHAVIVMPVTVPKVKLDAVRRIGGDSVEVVLCGNSYSEAQAEALRLQYAHSYTVVHPFDDPDVIAGQATIGLEILRQHPGPLEAVFVPVGGGGLCAGVAAYIKYVRPDIKVIAVEPEDAACLAAAMEKNRRVVLPHVGIFADGVAVAQIGEETFRVLKKTIDGVVTVSTDEICAAIKDIFEDTRSIAEPAGALALAGLKKYAEQHQLKHAVLLAIDSGANTNFDRLRYISERTEIGEKREAVLAVTIPERPGSFKTFCKAIGKRNITEFNYRFADDRDAHIFVGMQVLPGAQDLGELLAQLKAKDYPVLDLTDNEMAKLHVRHMVGGHAPGAVKNEIVFRFEFPERPGALLQFLTVLGDRWNISMFHYRNHGAAFGRVLVGMQVPANERKDLEKYLKELNYEYKEETRNEAYQLFLA